MKLKRKDNNKKEITKVSKNIKDSNGLKRKIANAKNNTDENANSNTKGNDKINGKSTKNNNIDKFSEILSLLDNIDELVAPNSNSNSSKKYKDAITDIFNIAVNSSTKQYGPLKAIVDVLSTSSSSTSSSIDVESIWEQLQLRNKPILRKIKKKTIQLISQYQ